MYTLVYDIAYILFRFFPFLSSTVYTPQAYRMAAADHHKVAPHQQGGLQHLELRPGNLLPVDGYLLHRHAELFRHEQDFDVETPPP